MAKPLKTLAELKAETLAELEREKEEHRIAEEKKKAAAAAKAKENKEKDLIGAKDSAKLNPVIEKVPAKTSTKTNLGTSKQAASDLIAKAAGAQGGIDKIEAAKTEKAAAQARKNKEADLPGFDGYAYQRQLAEQKEAERLEYLNIKEARDKKSLLEKQLEQLKAQAKAETAKAGTVQIVASGRKGGLGSFVDPETQKRIDELEKEISDLNKNITLADRSQSGKYLYNRASDAADFEEFSKEQAKEEKAINPHQQNIGRENETLKGYMTDEEKAVYNYYLNKFGKAKAEEFFESIEEDLNFRQAQAIFSGNEGKVVNEYIQGAAAGLESAKAGYKGAINMILGIDEPQPTSTFDYVSQMAREDLGKSGIKLPEALGGSSIGQIGFDVVNTTANMLPSIMLGTLGGSAVGAVGIGASAAGNAYNSAIKEGYSEEQARNYAALVGGSEAALGYVLGGIKSTGGKISNAVLGKLLPKIDSALAKAAVNVGGKYLSEMGEEYLQEILTPVFGNITLMEENKIDLLSPEAIYAGILGGLSAAGIAVFDGSANVPEVFEKAEIPVPFDGKAQPGTEAALVADKITEIENRPISEAEKAAKMEEVMEKAAQFGKEPGLVEEAEKFKNYHTERQAEFDEAVEIGKKLGVLVDIDPNIVGNGIHTSDGRIIINPNTENPALQVFVHELTHDIETSGLYESFSKKILEHASQIGLDVNKIRAMVIEDYKAAGHDLTDTQANAEIVAKYCEQHLFTDEKAIRRLCDTEPTIFQKIKNWISDMIVKFKGTAEERFLLEAERLYEKALATRGEVSGAGIEQHSYDYSKPFEQQVDDWKAGKIPQKDTLVVGATPKVFQKVGFNALPMTINLTHVDYAINGTKDADHYYGEIDFKKLPQAIEKPIAVFVSKTHPNTSVVALVDLPINGKNSVIPITVDGFGRQNNIMIDSNAIVSVHGKNGALKQLSDAIADDAKGIFNLLYINKKEAQSLLRQAGPQWSGVSIPRDGFIHSIRESGSPVKPKLDNVTESLQFKRWFGDWQKHPQNASKVVNPDGTPKVVYHGTFNDFWTFDINKSSDINDLGKGLYFSSDYDDSKNNYANKEGADIAERIEALAFEYFEEMGHSEEDLYDNEFVADYNKAYEMAEAEFSEDKSRVLGVYLDIKNPVYVVEGGVIGYHYEDVNGNTLKIDIEDAKKLGYDGIIDKTVSMKFPGAGLNQNSEHYVVFEPTQIKSATDNIGTFDPQNPDIRYSTGRGFDEMAGEAKADEMAANVKTVTMERANKDFDVENWKSIAESINPEIGIWRMKDFARVLDSAAGGNKILRQQLYDLYEKPLNEA